MWTRGMARDGEGIALSESRGIMTSDTRALLMIVRKVLRELLGALEDYLGMERSIARRVR